MEQSKIEEIIIKISAGLAEMNANLKAALDVIKNHEQRIQVLEQDKGGSQSFWRDTVSWLVKTLLIGAVAVAALSGAGGILSKIFGL